MKKYPIVVLAAFGRTEDSYRNLIATAPLNNTIFVIPYTDYHFGNLTLVNSLTRYFQSFGIHSAHIVAHSLGGVMGIQLAVEQHKLVKSLTLIDSAGISTQRRKLIATTIGESMFQYPVEKLEDNIRVVTRILRHPVHAWRALSYVSQTNVVKYAQNISVPTLLLWGEKDNVIPVRIGTKLSQLIPKSRLEILRGLDHDWLLHKPDVFWHHYRKAQSFLHT